MATLDNLCSPESHLKEFSGSLSSVFTEIWEIQEYVYVCKCAPQSGNIAEFLRENLFECWQHGRAGPAADIPLDYPTSSHTVSYSFSSDTDSVIGLFFKQFKDFKKVIKGQPHEGGGGRTETNTADRTDVSMQ